MVEQRPLTAKAYSFLFIFTLLAVIAVCRADNAAGIENIRIADIATTGNITIGKTAILSVVRARPGQLFNKASATEDAKRIAGLEGVQYAYYNTEIIDNKVKLTFVVVEKNLIRSIVFNGNNKFSSARLTREVGLKRGDYLDVFLVRNGTESLKELYYKKGYAFVEIAADEEKMAQGQVVYNITEGPAIKVKKVLFRGNISLKSRKLKSAIKTRTRNIFFWPVYFNKQVISDDIVKLKQVYQQRGFLDAQVKAAWKFSDNKKSAQVTFTIDEGTVYLVEKLVLNGNEFFDEESLLGDLKLRPDRFYSEQRAEYDTKHILKRYRETGFVDAKVEHQRHFRGAAKVVAEYNIIPGRRFRIGRISITGNVSVHDKVIRQVLDEEGFRPGQWFNADTARGDGKGRLEETVKRTVLAESIFIKAGSEKTDRTAASRDGYVSIVEGQTGSVMLGAGIASDTGLVGQVVFDQRNFDIADWPESLHEFITGRAFKGAGQRMRISLNPGTEQTSFSVSFSEPYLYDKPISLDVIASGFERAQESYDEERTKGYVGLEKRYDDKWRRGISFRAENVDVAGLDTDAPQEIIDVKGDNSLFGLRLYIRKDTTDDRFRPSSGYNFNAGYEQVGGDHTFGEISGTQRWYTTLHEDLAERKTILETKLHAATIIGDAPPFEKFYAGGTGTIRGFDYRGVSTRGLQTSVADPQKKDPIGSDWILAANAEIAVPLTTEVLSLLFFTDAAVIDSGPIRTSGGVGLQILIPQWFGPVPMRFEFAVPFTKDDDDETRVFNFSIGALF